MTISDLHIAILVCDTPIEHVTDKHGDFGENHRDLFKKTGKLRHDSVCYQVAIKDSELLDLIYVGLENGIINGSIRGLVFTGSRYDAFALDIPWMQTLNRFVQDVALKLENFPIYGTCFGHQLLALHLGAEVGRNKEHGWECGHTKIKTNPEIFNLEKSPFSGEPRNFYIAEFHQDIVKNVPPPTETTTFVNIGSTDITKVQGILSVGPLKVLTFQGHPEFHPELVVDLLELMRHELPDHDAILEESIVKPNDTDYLGSVIVDFLNSN